MNQFNAPVLLFVYKRISEAKKVIDSLLTNKLVSETDLFIFSDGPQSNTEQNKIYEIRKYLRTITGFNSVKIIERKKNYGLAKSIITGVTEVIDKHGRVIVLEDDLLTSSNFLCYMNQALDFYEKYEKIWSVSGYSYPLKYPKEYDYDVIFGYRASSCGWATWKDRWERIDWKISDYMLFKKNRKEKKEFKKGGSDLCKMLNDQMTGKIDSWAIRFCYNQYKNNMYDVYPVKSKIENIGFSEDSTNTPNMKKRYLTVLDDGKKQSFNFPKEVKVDPKISIQFAKRFSVLSRIKYKIWNVFL